MDENQDYQQDVEVNIRRKALKDRAGILVNLGNTVRESIRDALEGRENVIAVRVNDDSLAAIDSLVEAGLFKTRSEAAAFLIHEGMRSKTDILQRVQETVSRITQLREDLKNILGTEAEDKPAAPGATGSERVDLSPAV
jgi:Arc/MetJ-type ribon-helix-helix transcriptional regulator